MKKALWITCGPRNNAGDALLYEVTKALFSDLVELDFRFVDETGYIRQGDDSTHNVVIGPGGLFVQTNSSRHLHSKLQEQWAQFEDKAFHLWSTGILTKPKDEEVPRVLKVTERTSQVVVRASIESRYFRDVAGIDSQWAPCASLFTDQLLGIEDRTSDVVVVNFDEYLFTEENIADHPLRRFVDYAESEGLLVRSMVNAAGDSNPLMLDLFPVIDIDRPHLEKFLSGGPIGREFNLGFNKALSNYASFGPRYTDARFAFGKRLHAWLPFLAFDKPAAFIGMSARHGMPRDYFGTRDFLCAVPRKRGMTRDQFDQMADMMVDKLRFFVKHEDKLKSKIVGRRAQLWDQLQAQAVAFSRKIK